MAMRACMQALSKAASPNADLTRTSLSSTSKSCSRIGAPSLSTSLVQQDSELLTGHDALLTQMPGHC